jgi:acetyl esterase/lipase
MKILFAFSVLALSATAAPPSIKLWPEGVPGIKANASPEKITDGRITNIHDPSLLVFKPENPCGTAIIFCSGGGYTRISANPNGDTSTRLLNKLGLTVFVLKYRLSDYGHPAPLQDVMRAVRLVRSRAGDFGVAADRIGVMGVSAGAHLSACAATLWESADGKTGAALDAVSGRPDFAVLVYPVISMSAPFTHIGSRNALLGNNPSPALCDALSVEKHVRRDGPPTFVAATMADTVVPVQNSLAFYQSLVAAGVPAGLHLYPQGSHANCYDPQYGPTADWPLRMEEWLRFNGLLDNKR